MRQPSNMPAQRMFSTVPAPTIGRSTFDRSHSLKTTLDSGFLYPVLVDEILPGDTIRLDATFFARINTLLHPFMDNVHVDALAFMVPVRLVWENFQKFMGEQDNPEDSIDYLIPRIYHGSTSTWKFAEGSLYDYMGLPVERNFYDYGTPGHIPVSALPLRVYNLIYNKWLRDENLQDSVTVPMGDGPDALNTYSLLRRGKRHDYFTSALPWAQKGDPVMLPLGTTAPVVGDGKALGLLGGIAGAAEYGLGSQFASSSPSNSRVFAAPSFKDAALGYAQSMPSDFNGTTYSLGLQTDPAESHVYADLTAATAISVNDLRYAVAVQQLLEMYARGGTRYVELLKSEFGVTSPDFRLQRPEYIGGSSVMLNATPVPQTMETTDDSPQGNLAAYGQVTNKLRLSYSSTEHQYLMVLLNVRADISYQQQLQKMWTRRTRYDFYHPAFAHLGEQAVMGYEANYIDGMPSDYNMSVFGYQERYAEYRYKPSMVTGKMRSIATGSLDTWHLALDYENSPVYLNDEFIADKPPMERVIAVTDEPEFNVDCWFDYKHTRPMPVRSIPGLRRF